MDGCGVTYFACLCGSQSFKYSDTKVTLKVILDQDNMLLLQEISHLPSLTPLALWALPVFLCAYQLGTNVKG